MGGTAYAECDGRIERPPEPDLLLKLVAQAQQGARYWRLAAHRARVDDVSSSGKPLPELPDLGGTLTERTLTDPLALRPPLLSAASRSLCSSYAPPDQQAVPRTSSRRGTHEYSQIPP